MKVKCIDLIVGCLFSLEMGLKDVVMNVFKPSINDWFGMLPKNNKFLRILLGEC